MANSNLQGRTWDIDSKIMKHLKRNFNAYNGSKNVEGYERLRNLVSSDSITYENLKRIKNFFDNFNGKTNETPYLLNGGSIMKNWVDSALEDARDEGKTKEKNMKDTGMGNHYEKEDLGPSKMGKAHKSNLKQTMGEGINEITKINNLINNINKNRKLWHTEE